MTALTDAVLDERKTIECFLRISRSAIAACGITLSETISSSEKKHVKVRVLDYRCKTLVCVLAPLLVGPELRILVLLPVVEALTTHGAVVQTEELAVPLQRKRYPADIAPHCFEELFLCHKTAGSSRPQTWQGLTVSSTQEPPRDRTTPCLMRGYLRLVQMYASSHRCNPVFARVARAGSSRHLQSRAEQGQKIP